MATVKATRVDRTLPKYKSKWEQEYADILQARLLTGEIRWWKYEALRFRLAAGAMVTIDFAVVAKDGTFEMHEVKGQWREAAKVRWKFLLEHYPFVFLLVRKKGKHFTVEDV